ncbi:YodC family protein [Salmonella enterica subsp. enterica serovar Java]|nr:YodC family protein [Salmonella enterica subsp. enterica serovar Java]
MQNCPSSFKVKTFHLIQEAGMVFSVSEEVTVKEGGPRMIVTGYSSGMVECRWYDGFGVKREAFHENDLVPGKERRVRDEAR